jgi:hypothetical protein
MSLLPILILTFAFRAERPGAEARRVTARWIPDTIALNASTLSALTGARKWSLSLSVNASGVIYDEEFLGGHYKVSFDLYNTRLRARLGGVSECVNLISPAPEAQAVLGATLLSEESNKTNSARADSLLIINVMNFGDGGRHAGRNVYTELQLEGNESFDLRAELLFTGCLPIRTVGMWKDPHKWQNGVVPAALDDVEIPAGSGVIDLSTPGAATSSLTMHGLRMSGGEIVAQMSGCYQNWSSVVSNGVG